MKKLFASLACAALLITALTGCGQKTGSTRTPEELTQLYSQAITESGGEMVEYNPVITQIDDENEINGMILESMGLKEEDMPKIARCIWLAATDFENKADYIRSEVTKLCERYPIYQ